MAKLKLRIKKEVKGIENVSIEKYEYTKDDEIYFNVIKENKGIQIENLLPELVKIYKQDTRITTKSMQFFLLGKYLPEYNPESQILLFDNSHKEYEIQRTFVFIQHFLMDFYYAKMNIKINNGISHFMLLWPSPEGIC